MKLSEAREILKEVDGRSYSFVKAWGLSLTRVAIRTIENRKSATKDDRIVAERILNKILRKW